MSVISSPELRFPGFNDKLTKKNFAEIFTFKNGLNADKERYGKGTKYISVNDIIKNQFVTYDNIENTVETTNSDLNNYSVEYGDILFQRSSETREEVGQSNIYLDHKPAVFGGFVIRGRIKTGCEPRFINYLLKTPALRRDITSRSGGSTRYNIGQESLSHVDVIIPSLLEQRKIADFLMVIDEKIFIVDQKVKQLENYKNGLTQAILTQRIHFKNKNGKYFPAWQERLLSDVLVIGSKEAVSDTGRYNKITIKLHKHGVEFSQVGREMADTRPFYVRKEGEIIIGKQNYFNGSIAILDKKFDGAICSNAIMSFRVVQNNKFVYEYISSPAYLKKRESLANGTGQKELSEKDFLRFSIQVPVQEEQQKIADFLMQLDEKINSENKKLEQAKKFKKALLNKMLV